MLSFLHSGSLSLKKGIPYHQDLTINTVALIYTTIQGFFFVRPQTIPGVYAAVATLHRWVESFTHSE